MESVDVLDSKSGARFSASAAGLLDFTGQYVLVFKCPSVMDLLIPKAVADLWTLEIDRAGMLELVDEADSKSVGLITRVGSSPTTGTKSIG